MTFEEFQSYILEHLLEGWLEEAEVEIRDIKRNNGVVYRGLSIREPGKKATPSLCLNDLYLFSKGGENMEEVIERIRDDYRWRWRRQKNIRWIFWSFPRSEIRLFIDW